MALVIGKRVGEWISVKPHPNSRVNILLPTPFLTPPQLHTSRWGCHEQGHTVRPTGLSAQCLERTRPQQFRDGHQLQRDLLDKTCTF